MEIDSVESDEFEVTVESEAVLPGSESAPNSNSTKSRESKAKPQSNKKYKEPAKDKVDLMASSLQDVYEVTDAVIHTGISMTGKGDLYPEGLFKLDPEKAKKMSRALIQINNSLPQMAERINRVSAPAILVSTLLADLVPKGLIVFGILKSQKPGQ